MLSRLSLVSGLVVSLALVGQQPAIAADRGDVAAGVVLGAVVGGVIASQSRPVYSAPPPPPVAYYPPPPVAYYPPQPVYYEARPVYYEPRPVYYRPYPVVVAPGYRYYDDRPHHGHHRHGHDRW